MEIDQIIDLICKKLKDNLDKTEWVNSHISTEVLGFQIKSFTINLTLIASCDPVNISDETVGLFAEKHENICVSIWMEIFDSNDHRMRMPYLRMTRILENKIKDYLKD